MSYQDIWVNGQVKQAGDRLCEDRYAPLKEFLLQYERPFTVLDLGASEGYFSFRIAQDFPATCVMVDDTEDLENLCHLNEGKIIYLRKKVTLQDLMHLSSCEHFDVVLCLNILHHFENWKRIAPVVLSLGDHVIVETPAKDEVDACNGHLVASLYRWLITHTPNILGQSDSHLGPYRRPIWHFARRQESITRSFWGAPKDSPLGDVFITSDFSSKVVEFTRKAEVRNWIPGINVRTYQCLNGIFPDRKTVADLIEAVKIEGHHGDIRPWNFIFDGEQVTLIDGCDDRANYSDDGALQQCADAVRDGFLGTGADYDQRMMSV
jgi:SAM-dependent methyltransferase